MSRKAAVFLLVLGCIGPAAADTEVETFDSDLAIFALAFDNHDPYNNFGWSNTDNAGGSPGELGGVYARHEFAYVGAYAGVLTSDDTIVMRGKAYFKDTNFDGMLFIGFFKQGDPPEDGQFVCGISIAEPREPGWRVRLQVAGAQEPDPHYVADQTEWSFDLTYSNGVLSGTIGPTTEGDPLDVSLTADLGDEVIDAFGVGTYSSGGANETCEFYLDDLEFSVMCGAHDPDPEDGYEDVCPQNPVLRWEAGTCGLVFRHAVYFGTDEAAVAAADTNSPEFKLYKRATHLFYNTGSLSRDAAYYWRIDEQYGVGNIGKGPVWSFTINDGAAFDPYPKDGASSVPIHPVLTWSPGCYSTHHDVYFGTSFEDVNVAADPNTAPGRGRQMDTLFDPGQLEGSTTYYWRIDEVNQTDANLWRGDVWSFKIQDPNLVLWYKFDEGSGAIAHDSSGYGHDAVVDGPEDLWDPTGGRFGGSRGFDDDTDVQDIPLAVTADLGTGVSVSCWLKDSHRPGTNNWVFGWGSEFGYSLTAAVAAADGRNVYFQAGNDTNDVLTWDMVRAGIQPGALEGWHHWVFLKNEASPEISIYFDGERVDTNSVVDPNLSSLKNTAGKIGAVPWHGNDLVGKVDDFRLFTKALTENEISALFRGGELELAWGPKPYDGQMDVTKDVILEWRPGDYAAFHDVYFATEHDAVDDADTSSMAYKGRHEANEYDPCGLELEKTYYWRIDEVNDTNVWRGPTWKFTVANFLLVDDMESYRTVSGSGNEIFDTWDDGFSNLTGSEVALEYGSEMINGGEHSMRLKYNNTVAPYKYSEIDANTTGPRPGNLKVGSDWTDAGVRGLTLFFYGTTGNDITQQMYVALQDGSNNIAVAGYGDWGEDINDVSTPAWRQWDIPLSDFNDGGVEMTDVAKVRIGFGDRDNPAVGGSGTVFFDDIRLYLPKCVPWIVKPAADFSNDCIVDLADVAIMAEDWLRMDKQFDSVSAPNYARRAGWWPLDGSAYDESGNYFDGLEEGDYSWIDGWVGTGAIELKGNGGRILVPHAAMLNPQDQVSVCAWVYYSTTPSYSARVVAKGADTGDRECYGLEVNGEDTATWFVRDANTNMYGVDSSQELRHNEWTHIAGTYDGNTVKCYVNAQMSNSNAIGAVSILFDTNSLAIGNRADATNRAFIGRIDDVQVYEYALSQPEIAYVATENLASGLGYLPLEAQSNLWNEEQQGEQAVNLRDYAVLMDSWLEQILWP
ncbi:MAG: LamG domain-containing protein [Planctomycetota bacterium]|jgi:hypothetical protein